MCATGNADLYILPDLTVIVHVADRIVVLWHRDVHETGNGRDLAFDAPR